MRRPLLLLSAVLSLLVAPASAEAASFEVSSPTVTEGDSGTPNLVFSVTLRDAATATPTFTVEDVTTSSADHGAPDPASSMLVQDVPVPVTVPVNDDTVDEVSPETLKLKAEDVLLGATGEGIGSINDNDPSPTVSVADAGEVDEGAGKASFKLSLSAPSEQTVTVSYSTEDGTAKGPGDYEPQTERTVTFAPDAVEETVDVPVNDDAIDEPSQDFSLRLSNPQNATIAEGSGTGTATITDNDEPTATVSAGDAAPVFEGAGNAAFTVSLSGASEQTVTVAYATEDGTAKAGSDYDSRKGTVTFSPGQTDNPVTVMVPVRQDVVLESDEQFKLNLSSPQNASLGDSQALGTIRNDDPANLAPTARFFANPPRAFLAKLVVLDGRGSSDPEGRPLNFAWDLDGNGSHETPTGSDPQVITAFCSPGTHRLGLRVTDPGSPSDSRRRSSATTRSVDVVQASPENSCDQVAPQLRISRISRSLRRALRRGLAVRLRCSEACTMGASAGVNRRTGRQFGLRGRRRTLGRAAGAVTSAGSRRLVVKFSRTARRRLRRARRVRVTLRFTVKDAALNPLTVRRTIILRR